MNTLSPLRSCTSCPHHLGHNVGCDNAEVQEMQEESGHVHQNVHQKEKQQPVKI